MLELFDYWQQYPPVHLLVRGYIGYEAPAKPSSEPVNFAEVGETLTTIYQGTKTSLDHLPAAIQRSLVDNGWWTLEPPPAPPPVLPA